jgi:hypothetical protein
MMAVIPNQGVTPIPTQVSRRAAAPVTAYSAPVTVPAQRAATALLDAPTVVLPRVDYGGQEWCAAEPDTTQPIALSPGRALGTGRWTFEPDSDRYVWFPANWASYSRQ